jgi:hypothetical protein
MLRKVKNETGLNLYGRATFTRERDLYENRPPVVGGVPQYFRAVGSDRHHLPVGRQAHWVAEIAPTPPNLSRLQQIGEVLTLNDRGA